MNEPPHPPIQAQKPQRRTIQRQTVRNYEHGDGARHVLLPADEPQQDVAPKPET